MTVLVSAMESFSRDALTGIDILVIGAGIAGFCGAIGMYRKGHNVRLFEGKDGLDSIGDFIGIGSSATRHFEKWPGFADAFRAIRYGPVMSFRKYDGELLGGPFNAWDETRMPLPVPRPKFQRLLFEYAAMLGIPVTFNKKVQEYYEIPDKRKAGVVMVTGEKFEGDLVIACDGVGSAAWKLIQGTQTKPIPSGFATYRVAMPINLAHEDPLVAHTFPVRSDGREEAVMFLAPYTHFIILIAKDEIVWVHSHQDKGNASESWSSQTKIESVLEDVAETGIAWDPAIIALMKQTPSERIVDWRLSWRDPVEKWVSNGGRVVQVGDAAHTFLPTSATGGTQAIEDVVSLAACLAIGGKNNIPLATRVNNTLRFERVSCCQLNGLINREIYHKTDFDMVRKNPERLRTMTPTWITRHDPESYVYNNWSDCVNCLVTGQKFKNTNTPPGYDHRPWTMEGLLGNDLANERIELPGDWS